MPDIESHPRLLELIGLAKDAATLHQQMKARNEATTQVDEAIGAIYSDIGRLVYRLMSQGSRAESADTAEGSDDDRATFLPFTEEATQSTVPTEEEVAERMNWYTDEVEVDDAEPLFTKEDRLDELTDIPESDPISEEVEMDTVTDHEDYEVTTIAQLRRNSGASDHPLRRLSDESSDPTWAYKLTQLLKLLELPDSPQRDEMAVEASRVQWAASELHTRLDGLPQSIQVCIIGMLAARAQHLRVQLAIDVGPRLALDRLRRYRIDEELPTVAGLLAQPGPENDSWADDVQAWWDLLHPIGETTEMDT